MPPKDYKSSPFERLVILGESTVEGGPWLERLEDRFADVLARLINECQESPVEYHNKGIGANAISPRSPGYPDSRKPSALERYQDDVVGLNPDLFVLCYGLNDMRAGMEVSEFIEDLAAIVGDVQAACQPVTVLTTVYYMTAWQAWPPFDKGSRELAQAYNEAIRDFADTAGCIVADVWEAEGCADWLIHFDGVHANKAGNLIIANRVFEALAQNVSGLTRDVWKRDEDTSWTKDTRTARAGSGDPFVQTW
ncbi:MAG: hypothetical protein KJ052_04340 [Candidatus Hydrogenedentes bacterium]|nr:hypothetical protein [Candidatus Hydrogenedentota bacterium]